MDLSQNGLHPQLWTSNRKPMINLGIWFQVDGLETFIIWSVRRSSADTLINCGGQKRMVPKMSRQESICLDSAPESCRGPRFLRPPTLKFVPRRSRLIHAAKIVWATTTNAKSKDNPISWEGPHHGEIYRLSLLERPTTTIP